MEVLGQLSRFATVDVTDDAHVPLVSQVVLYSGIILLYYLLHITVCTPGTSHFATSFELSFLQLFCLFRGDLDVDESICTGYLLEDGEVAAAAIVLQAGNGPGTDSRHVIVLGTRFHGPEQESEDSLEDQKDGTEWHPRSKTWVWRPADESDMCNLVSFVDGSLNIDRSFLALLVFSDPFRDTTFGICATADVDSWPTTCFLQNKDVDCPKLVDMTW